MCSMPATLTSKSRPYPVAKQSALIADLACIGRVDKGDRQAIPLRSIRYTLNEQVVAKAVQFTTRSFTNMCFLRSPLNLKVFKHKNCIFRNPLAKLCCRFSTKCFRFITLFPRQTFQDTTHRTAVFAQFLFRGFLTLNSSSGLSSAFPVFFKLVAGDNHSIICCRRHQHIFNPNIDSYRNKPLWVLNMKCDTECSLAVWTNAERVLCHRIFKITAKCFGNSKSNFLSSSNGPDRQLSVFRKRGITSSLSDQEQCPLSTEDKRTSGWTFIGLRRRIRSSHKSDSRTSHLRVKGRFNLVIDFLMQAQRASWRLFVKRLFGNTLLISVEFLYSYKKILRPFEDYWYASLDQHADKILLNKININLTRRPRFLPSLKEGVPARAL